MKWWFSNGSKMHTSKYVRENLAQLLLGLKCKRTVSIALHFLKRQRTMPALVLSRTHCKHLASTPVTQIYSQNIQQQTYKTPYLLNPLAEMPEPCPPCPRPAPRPGPSCRPAPPRARPASAASRRGRAPPRPPCRGGRGPGRRAGAARGWPPGGPPWGAAASVSWCCFDGI